MCSLSVWFFWYVLIFDCFICNNSSICLLGLSDSAVGWRMILVIYCSGFFLIMTGSWDVIRWYAEYVSDKKCATVKVILPSVPLQVLPSLSTLSHCFWHFLKQFWGPVQGRSWVALSPRSWCSELIPNIYLSQSFGLRGEPAVRVPGPVGEVDESQRVSTSLLSDGTGRQHPLCLFLIMDSYKSRLQGCSRSGQGGRSVCKANWRISRGRSKCVSLTLLSF